MFSVLIDLENIYFDTKKPPVMYITGLGHNDNKHNLELDTLSRVADHTFYTSLPHN